MRRLAFCFAVATCATLATPAYAQDPVAGAAVLTVKIDTQIVANGYRASQLIGSDIYNEGDDAIGKVDDLIVAGDGTLTLAIISVGSFLGLGGKNVAVPTGLFEAGQDGKIVLPGATKEGLEKLPDFTYAN
jgi:hypothetical protein